MAKKENKAEAPQPKTETPVSTVQNSMQENIEKEAATKQPQTGAEQPTPGSVTSDAAPAAKPTTQKTEPKVSDAVQKVGKALLKSNPDMSVVYMTADGRGFYERNDADNHARTLNNKAVTPVKK